MHIFRFCLFLIISISIFSSKAAEITGKIVDSDDMPLPGASVLLVALPDSIKIGLQAAASEGEFSWKNLKPGQYNLSITMTGMESVSKSLSIKQEDETLNIGSIPLTENAIALKEMVVTGVRAAVVAKQDTIEFNADSFHTSPNATVDQLLKKLPGVEVSSDGSITSNGKTITKILVDGKEFFADDPQMASKNLPSNMVDKVQVIDRKSDFTRLTGIDDGEEETVINLKVKKDMNNGWFGNVSAGYGIDDKYNGSFVINNFHNGNQITLLGGLNNINENGFSDRGRGRFRDFGGSGGITTAQRLGLNFNVGHDEIFRIGGNILYSHSDTKRSQKSYTQYLFPDSTSYQNSSTLSEDKGHNLNLDLRLQWNINDNNTLDFRPRFAMNFRDTEKEDFSSLQAGDEAKSLVNTNENFQNNRGKSFETSGNLIFNHKFASKPGRAFSVNLQYSFSKTLQKSLSWSNILYFLINDEDEEIYRFLDNKNFSNSIEGRLTWTEPLGNPLKGNFLTFSYRTKYQWNNADLFTYNLPFLDDERPLFDFNYLPEDKIFDPDLSNSFRNKFFTQELQMGYKKVSKTLNLEAGLLFSPSSSASHDLINNARDIPTRWVWNVSPFANVRVKFNDSSSMRANYRARTSQPSISQLQPVPDVSDPLNIKIGNPELKPTFTQNIGINFSNYNSERQQSLMLMINTSFTLNSIVARTFTNPETGGRTTTYSNVNGNTNIFFMGMYTGPFSNKKWRFNARLNSRFASTPGYINGDFNRSENISLSPSAGLTFSSDIFQASLNPNYSLSTIHNSLPEQRNRTTHSYGFSADASLYLPFGLDISTDLNFAANSGYTQGYNINQWLWNAQLSYSFLYDKSLTFSVKAYDILHQKKNINRTVSANAIVDSDYNDLTRYVLFSITWNFNSLKKKNKGPEGEESMFMGPPPGERPGERPGEERRTRGQHGGPMGPPPGGSGGRPPF
ncbi:MAG: outer membrane beta-barrel protein [Muribaculaceae bacterium]|nr:outer membrane beta-barrel protein [Muribaculaceae bacterium]